MVSATSFYGIDLAGGPAGPSSTDEVLRVVDLLRPRRTATPLVRIGGDTDGAYLVPDDLEGVGACFSPGANRIKHFEDHLTDHHGIAAHMCDFSCTAADFRTPLREGRQTFAKKWLDVVPGDDSIRLDDWVRQHDPGGDLVLQMDIEGAEYRNLLATPDEVLARFRIIVLELHGLGSLLEAPVLHGALAPFVDKLAGHFTAVHAHPNNCCGEVTVPGTDVRVPRVLEVTWLRHDRVRPEPGPVSLPHPLDVGRNVPRNPPLFLSEDWCRGPRPLDSRVKMLEDEQAYRQEVGSATATDELAGVLALTMQSMQTVGRLRPAPRRRAGAADLVEVARGRPFRLSSAYGSGGRDGVVRARPGYFFHTGFGAGQWIRIDLGRRRRVRRIEVTNRTDGHQDRARFLFATLSGGPRQPLVFPLYRHGDLPGGAWDTTSLDVPGVRARYVTLTSPTNTALHLSDVAVLADDEEAVAAAAPATGSTGPGGRARRLGRALRRRVRRSGPSARGGGPTP